MWITSNSFITPSAYLSSTAQTDFPASNVNAYTHPYRPFKSSGTIVAGTTYVGVDFGSATALSSGAVVIDNINVASGTIQTATNSSFTSGTVNLAATISQDPVDGRYKLYASAATLGTKQYARFIAGTATTTDGSTKLMIGSFVFLSSITTWAIPLGSSDYGEEFDEAFRPNDDFVGGGEEPVIYGNPRALLSLGAAYAPRSSMRSTLLGLQRYGVRPFVFYANDGDTSQVYIVRRMARMVTKRGGPNHLKDFGLQLAEAN